MIAAIRKEPSPTTPSAFDADQSVAFEKAPDSGEARCLVSNQLLYISKRHWSLHEQDEMNSIRRSAEQSSTNVSPSQVLTNCRNEYTNAWPIEEVGEKEEGHDKSAAIEYAFLKNLSWIEGGGKGTLTRGSH